MGHFIRKIETHYPERHRAIAYLSEWSTRATCAGLSLPRDLVFLRQPPVRDSAENPQVGLLAQPLAHGEIPARQVSVQRPRPSRRPATHAVPAMPSFAVWLSRRTAQGVSPRTAQQEWNGLAMIHGLTRA